MFLKKKADFFKTLSFRLTLLYTGLFAVSILIAFWSIFAMTEVMLTKDADQGLLRDVEELASILEQQGFESLVDEVYWEAKTEGEETVFYRLFDMDGRGVLSTNTSSWGELETGPKVVMDYSAQDDPVFTTMLVPGRGFEARSIVAALGDDLVIQIGQSVQSKKEYLSSFVKIFGRVLPVVILIAATTGWFVARKAMIGVEEVTQTAFMIAKGDYQQRVPIKSRGFEIERLALAFNYMSERIQALINGIHEVTDNLAHDLRSPLTSLRGTAETTLINGQTIDDYKFMAGNTIEECDRLIGLVNAMLDISEAEAGAGKLDVGDVDISQVVKQACDLYLPLAEEKELSLSLQAPVSCSIRGDLKKIQRLIGNLLDNALKYTPPEGYVEIDVLDKEHSVEIAVRDSGVGIEEKDLDHIFQRFFRCDQSRTQEGNGLGLSLARAIVNVHSGTLQVESRPGSGSCFTVCLPKPGCQIADVSSAGSS